MAHPNVYGHAPRSKCCAGRFFDDGHDRRSRDERQKLPFTSAVFVRAERLSPLGTDGEIIMMIVRHVALLGERHATLFHLRFII